MQARSINTFRMQLPVPGSLSTVAAASLEETDVLSESVPAMDPVTMLRHMARTAAPAPPVVAAVAPQPQAPSRDAVCVERAHQWADYAMNELVRLGDTGRQLKKDELESINLVITQAAQHLQMLRQEAQTGTSDETKRLIDETLQHLQNAYAIYGKIPFEQYRATFFNAVYARYTIVNAEKENLGAFTRNAGRLGGSVPDFDMPSGGAAGGGAAPAAPAAGPTMPMGPNMVGSAPSAGNNMTMPGMSMPIPYAGMPIPGMPYPFPQPGVPLFGMPPLMPMPHLAGMQVTYPGSEPYTGGVAASTVPQGGYPAPTATPVPVVIPPLRRAA